MSRKSITLSDGIYQRAEDLIKAGGFYGLSDLIATLIREEFNRRHPTTPLTPPPPPVAPPPDTAIALGRALVDHVVADLSKRADPQNVPPPKFAETAVNAIVSQAVSPTPHHGGRKHKKIPK